MQATTSQCKAKQERIPRSRSNIVVGVGAREEDGADLGRDEVRLRERERVVPRHGEHLVAHDGRAAVVVLRVPQRLAVGHVVLARRLQFTRLRHGFRFF